MANNDYAAWEAERRRRLVEAMASDPNYQIAANDPQAQQSGAANGVANLAGLAAGHYGADKLFASDAAAAPISALSGPEGLQAIPNTAGVGEAAAAPGALTSYVLPGAAALIGGYQGIKGIQQGNAARGGLGGAASGAGIGFMAGGPLGAGIGAGIGGLIGLGGSLMNQHKTEVEQKRLKKLADSGISTFDSGQPKHYVSRGQSIRPDLASDFVGNDSSGTFVNNKFSNSRNESDLTGKDIMGYAAFSEKFGNDWKNFSEPQREAVANAALAKGLVREHHGTIDVTFDPAFTFEARQLISKNKNKK